MFPIEFFGVYLANSRLMHISFILIAVSRRIFFAWPCASTFDTRILTTGLIWVRRQSGDGRKICQNESNCAVLKYVQSWWECACNLWKINLPEQKFRGRFGNFFQWPFSSVHGREFIVDIRIISFFRSLGLRCIISAKQKLYFLVQSLLLVKERHDRTWDHVKDQKAVTRNFRGGLNVPGGLRGLSLWKLGKDGSPIRV